METGEARPRYKKACRHLKAPSKDLFREILEMETRTERRTGVGLSRRTLLAGTAAAAGASAISWKVIAEQIETLKKEGWEANPVAARFAAADAVSSS